MKTTDSPGKNPCVSRRCFLSGCAACTAILCSGRWPGALFANGMTQTLPQPKEKAKIRLLFAYSPSDSPTWPNIGYDFEKRKGQILPALKKGCPDIEFLTVDAMSVEDATKVLEKDSEVDGYVVYMLGLGWAEVGETIAASLRPTIYVDNLYGGSGRFLISTAKAKRMNQNPDKTKAWKVAAVSSSDIHDVCSAINCFACMKKLKQSTILRVGTGFGAEPEAIRNVFGTRVLPMEFTPLNELYNKADMEIARQWANKWFKEADRVIEPTKDEILKSARMYLAMCELLRQNDAQAITINCLGGFYGNQITAYPCLGFFQLNNDGFVGACEADTTSTITMLVMTYLTGRPGYISDPVIDTSKNQIIYAHCVASNKVFGPAGRSNPYHIRNHSEDRKGAVVRSLMPLGEMTTTLEFDPGRRQVIFHQATAVANIDDDMACRTKLAAEVKGDIDKLMNYWDQWGWHRVTVYGDYKRRIQQFAALTGFDIVEEA
ncbi:MAG: hypothetical protein GX455_13965 [Phycisphaerae bacterium]|nr:hypothetical protein [Phycisphaerae bacterium]